MGMVVWDRGLGLGNWNRGLGIGDRKLGIGDWELGIVVGGLVPVKDWWEGAKDEVGYGWM